MDTERINDQSEERRVYDKIVSRLCAVYDPELPVNIYDLGLIYKISIDQMPQTPSRFKIAIDMTLTSAGCPMADVLPVMVKEAVRDVTDIAEIDVHLVWDPPWDPSRMTEAARFQLDMM